MVALKQPSVGETSAVWQMGHWQFSEWPQVAPTSSTMYTMGAQGDGPKVTQPNPQESAVFCGFLRPPNA